jgi:signal transduction histidine kinase
MIFVMVTFVTPFVKPEMIQLLWNKANLYRHDFKIPFTEIEKRCVELHNDQLDQIEKFVNSSDYSKDSLLSKILVFKKSSSTLFSAPFDSIRSFFSHAKDCFFEFVGLLVNGSDTSKPKSENPVDFFKNIKDMFEEVLKSHDIALEYNVNCSSLFNTDFIKIQRILQNLFFNAINAITVSKAEEKKIIFSVTQEEGSPKKLNITISNPGSIDPRLGDIFQEGVSSSRSKYNGFGLHIVKTLTQALGGTITLNTDDNRVEFKLSIPDCSQVK